MFNFNDPIVLAINFIIIVFIISETYSGYKKGFFESSVRFLGFVLSLVGAYILKTPLAQVLYLHLPFFKFDGLFKGVSVLNVIAYEVIAFVILFVILTIIVNIIYKITGLIDKLISAIFFLGIPNKILGAVVGFIQSFIILYFAIFAIKVTGNFLGMEMKPSLADNIINIPILKNTFGDSLKSLDEITEIAKNYENTKNKEEFNNKAIDILLDNNILTEDNLEKLVSNGKFNIIDNKEEE